MKIKIYFFLSNFTDLLNLDTGLGHLLQGSSFVLIHHSLLGGFGALEVVREERLHSDLFQKPHF